MCGRPRIFLYISIVKKSPVPRIIFWSIVFVASCAVLHFLHGYHFLYVSQEHMFLQDRSYILDNLFSMGGLSKLGADWLAQSWCRPYVAPVSLSIILLVIGLFTQGYLRRTFPGRSVTLLALIPVVVLFFLSYKDDFNLSRIIAFFLVSFFLALFSRLKSTGGRFVFAIIALAILIPATGWPSALFAFGVLLSFVTFEGGLRFNIRFPSALTVTLQLILLLVPGFFAYKASAGQDDFFKELDWHMYKDEPDKVLEALSRSGKDTFLYENFANWALARKGVLAENLFSYPQHNPYSLALEWKEIKYTAVLLSNVYWSMGHAALSQRMAFEANVCYDNFNPRMLQRLAETNLSYGYYDVARKYLERLAGSRPYRIWAGDRMRFLDNPAAVRADAVLGAAARGIPEENALCESKGDICWDLLRIARADSTNTVARDYAGAWMLLAKDTGSFLPFLEEFYDGKKLPKSLAEAVMILSEGRPELAERWGIDPSVASRYASFKEFYSQNAKSADIKQKMRREFGDTYWNYFLFTKAE